MIFLRKKEYGILRFWNNEVFENCMGVLEAVYEALSGPHSSLAAWLPPPPTASAFAWRLGFCDSPSRGEE